MLDLPLHLIVVRLLRGGYGAVDSLSGGSRGGLFSLHAGAPMFDVVFLLASSEEGFGCVRGAGRRGWCVGGFRSRWPSFRSRGRAGSDVRRMWTSAWLPGAGRADVAVGWIPALIQQHSHGQTEHQVRAPPGLLPYHLQEPAHPQAREGLRPHHLSPQHPTHTRKVPKTWPSSTFFEVLHLNDLWSPHSCADFALGAVGFLFPGPRWRRCGMIRTMLGNSCWRSPCFRPCFATRQFPCASPPFPPPAPCDPCAIRTRPNWTRTTTVSPCESVAEGAVSKASTRLAGDRWLERSLHTMETHLDGVHCKRIQDVSHALALGPLIRRRMAAVPRLVSVPAQARSARRR